MREDVLKWIDYSISLANRVSGETWLSFSGYQAKKFLRPLFDELQIRTFDDLRKLIDSNPIDYLRKLIDSKKKGTQIVDAIKKRYETPQEQLKARVAILTGVKVMTGINEMTATMVANLGIVSEEDKMELLLACDEHLQNDRGAGLINPPWTGPIESFFVKDLKLSPESFFVLLIQQKSIARILYSWLSKTTLLQFSEEQRLKLLERAAREDGRVVAETLIKRCQILGKEGQAAIAVTAISQNVLAADYLKNFDLDDKGMLAALIAVGQQDIGKAAVLAQKHKVSEEERFKIANACYEARRGMLLPFIDSFNLPSDLANGLRERCLQVETAPPDAPLPMAMEGDKKVQDTIKTFSEKYKEGSITTAQIGQFLREHVQELRGEDSWPLLQLQKELPQFEEKEAKAMLGYYALAAGPLELSYEEDLLLMPIQDKIIGRIALLQGKRQEVISYDECFKLIDLLNKKYEGSPILPAARLALAKYLMSQAIYNRTKAANTARRVGVMGGLSVAIPVVGSILAAGLDPNHFVFGPQGYEDRRPEMLQALQIHEEQDLTILLKHNAKARFRNSSNPTLFLMLKVNDPRAKVEVAKAYSENSFKRVFIGIDPRGAVHRWDDEETSLAIAKVLIEDDVNAIHLFLPGLKSDRVAKLLAFAAAKDVGFVLSLLDNDFDIKVKEEDVVLLEGILKDPSMEDERKQELASRFFDIALKGPSGKDIKNEMQGLFEGNEGVGPGTIN